MKHTLLAVVSEPAKRCDTEVPQETCRGGFVVGAHTGFHCIVDDARSLTTCSHVLQLFALISVVSAADVRAQSQELSPAQIAKMALPSTVTVLTESYSGDEISQGSGFIIGGAHLVATNWHVVADGRTITVIFSDGQKAAAHVAASNASADVAVLTVAGATAFPSLRTASDQPPVGSRVVVIGSPRGLSETVTEGILSAIREIGGNHWLQISAAISPGSSGGPVFDERGKVIGLSTLQLTQSQALNFAVPIRSVTDLLGGYRVAAISTSAARRPSIDDTWPTNASVATKTVALLNARNALEVLQARSKSDSPDEIMRSAVGLAARGILRLPQQAQESAVRLQAFLYAATPDLWCGEQAKQGLDAFFKLGWMPQLNDSVSNVWALLTTAAAQAELRDTPPMPRVFSEAEIGAAVASILTVIPSATRARLLALSNSGESLSTGEACVLVRGLFTWAPRVALTQRGPAMFALLQLQAQTSGANGERWAEAIRAAQR